MGLPRSSTAETKRQRTESSLGHTTDNFFQRHTFLLIISPIFLIIAIVLILTIFNHQLNPDATSYFAIAQKYAHGDIRHAINGYWGPLFSWLLVPAVWLGISLSIAGKFLSVIVAIVLLAVAYKFFESRNVNRTAAVLICIALSILLLVWSVTEAITPDLLLTLLTAIFAIQLSNFIARPTRGRAVFLGSLGACMYYTKGFGLFLFVGIIGLVALWQWLKVDHGLKLVLRRYAPIAIVLAVLTLPFIAVISVKYHQLTINNAGAYNQHVVGPYGKNMGQPVDYMGPLPPDKTATTVWEDPTIFTTLIPGWSPLDSRLHMGYFINNIVYKNILLTLSYIQSMGALVCAGVVVLFAGCFGRSRFRRDFVVFAGITGVMLVAYISVFVTARYLWTGGVLGLLALGLWLSVAMDKKLLTRAQLIAGGVLVCSTMALSAGYGIAAIKDPDAGSYAVAQRMRAVVPEGSKTIADKFSISVQACYYLKLACYNVMAPPPLAQFPGYDKQLKDLGISYYLDYHTREGDLVLQQFVKAYFVPLHTYESKGTFVTVYQVK